MPTIRFPRLEPDSAWRKLPAWKCIADCAALRAVMYYPKDQEKRDAFLETVEIFHIWENAHFQQQQISPSTARVYGQAIFATPPQQMLAQAEKHVGWSGEFVGRALIHVLREKASMEDVYAIIDPNHRGKSNSSVHLGFKASRLRQWGWQRYRSVANLWAALVYTREQTPASSALPDVLDQFFIAAEWFRIAGEAKRFKARSILNPVETWNLPPAMNPSRQCSDLDLNRLTQCDVARVVDRSHVDVAMVAGHMILPTGLGRPQSESWRRLTISF